MNIKLLMKNGDCLIEGNFLTLEQMKEIHYHRQDSFFDTLGEMDRLLDCINSDMIKQYEDYIDPAKRKSNEVEQKDQEENMESYTEGAKGKGEDTEKRNRV